MKSVFTNALHWCNLTEILFCLCLVWNSWSGCCWRAVCPGLLLLTSTRWCNKVSFSRFPGGKAIKALVCWTNFAFWALIHWELSLGISIPILCVVGGKIEAGGNAMLNFVISVFLERESETPAANTVSNQSNAHVGLLFCFSSPSPLSSLSRWVKSRACVKTRSCRSGERLPWMF